MSVMSVVCCPGSKPKQQPRRSTMRSCAGVRSVRGRIASLPTQDVVSCVILSYPAQRRSIGSVVSAGRLAASCRAPSEDACRGRSGAPSGLTCVPFSKYRPDIARIRVKPKMWGLLMPLTQVIAVAAVLQEFAGGQVCGKNVCFRWVYCRAQYAPGAGACGRPGERPGRARKGRISRGWPSAEKHHILCWLQTVYRRLRPDVLLSPPAVLLTEHCFCG